MSGMQKIIPEVNVKMDQVPNYVKMDPVHFYAKKTRPKAGLFNS